MGESGSSIDDLKAADDGSRDYDISKELVQSKVTKSDKSWLEDKARERQVSMSELFRRIVVTARIREQYEGDDFLLD